MTDEISRIGVVIPARDEEALVARCLLAVLAARDQLRAATPAPIVDVVLVADGCRDRTAEVAPDLGVRVIRLPGAGVGAARRAGVDDALLRGAQWIANTDADSVVPACWLERQIALASTGADVVVGTVRPDFAELTDAQQTAWSASHDRGQALGHVHGANLGVRASSYLASGGFLPLSEHEDNDLVRRLAARAMIVADGDLEVITSARRIGRTPGGYAGHLRAAFGPDPVTLDATRA